MTEPVPASASDAALQVPRHLAIIMDGNHRWARARGLPGSAGHRAGARAVRPVAEEAAELGIQVLTLFAFSTENWSRPRREVSLLLELMKRMLREDVDELHRNNIRIRIIGDRSRFSSELQRLMSEAEQRTADNQRMTLLLALNYGGRWDIANACRALVQRAMAGEIDPASIDEDMVTGETCMADVPAPDLCVRTGGDHRISNFLLWQLAYAELYFTPVCWPEFGADALRLAVDDFACRQRRFGRRP